MSNENTSLVGHTAEPPATEQSYHLRTGKSLAELEASVAHYPDRIRTEVMWLQGFLLAHCRGNVDVLRETAAKISAEYDLSRQYWFNLVNGYYFRSPTTKWREGGHAWASFLEIATALRRFDQEAQRTGQIAFVETPTYRCIANAITAVRAPHAVCRWLGVVGPTGAQKSAAAKFYATLNNHGAVTHLECPASGRLNTLQRKLVVRFNGGRTAMRVASERELVIRDNLNSTRCLILDNVQRLFDPRSGAKQDAFNWLLELQDETNCAIVLLFTTDFEDALTSGRAKGYFEQFVGRFGGLRNLLRLPDYTPASDLRAIARSFGIEPGKAAMEHLHNWSREPGRVRLVFFRLQRAQQFAKLDGRTRITLADMEEAAEFCPPSIGSDDEEGGAS